jgi:hypothetical protein
MLVLRGCLRGVVGLVALGLLLVGGWLQRDRLRSWFTDVRGVAAPAVASAPEPSAELADRAHAKLTALADGSIPRTALSELELQSLLLFRYEQLLPAFADSPRVELEGDRLRLRIRVPTDRLPRIDALGEAMALLPDTADVAVRGQLLPLPSGRIAFAIDDVHASRIPLPDRIIGPALERLGRRDEPGLPADAVALPLPPGATAAYVRGDSLVLLGRSEGDGPRT